MIRKRILTALSMALAFVMCMPLAAAATDKSGGAVPHGTSGKTGLELDIDISVAGKPGNWYGPGDLLVLTASVENHTEHPVSGTLIVEYPDNGCVVVAEPALAANPDTGDYDIKDLEPGMGAEAVMVLRAPDKTDVTDWVATAVFAIENGGGCAGVTADAHFGEPLLKADKEALHRDGVIRVWNEGTGGASHVKLRFLSKDRDESGKVLSDRVKAIGEGRIEIDLGGISAGGKLEKDFSGLLHQKLDPEGDVEIVYEDWQEETMPAENWE